MEDGVLARHCPRVDRCFAKRAAGVFGARELGTLKRHTRCSPEPLRQQLTRAFLADHHHLGSDEVRYGHLRGAG